MNLLPQKHFDKIYWAACSVVFVIVVLRCIFVPFAHDEVATFNFYIQPERFIPFFSHPDANGHFLMSATAWVCFKFFGSSPQSLRLPCIITFVVLCYGVFKVNKLFVGVFVKIIFSSLFILSFNFISFYSLCRGYGLSMALLVLALYYFFVYTRYGAFSHFFKFILLSQIALSANLTLIFVLAVTTGIVMIFQLKNKVFFNFRNIATLLVHFLLILFWIKYAFYLRESGALYYGSGDSYWKVTFETLIETVLFKNKLINIVVVTLFVAMLIYWCFKLVKEKAHFLLHNSFALSFFTLCGLIITFYLLKKLLNINYPEDRTGLFFYVFYALSFCFMVNEFKRYQQAGLLVIPAFYMAHFVSNVNIDVHPWRVYETIPASFFETLKSEQEKTNYPITVAGHRVREFLYAFQNYKSPVKLNQMTAPEALQMNCDYAVAYKQDKPWYDKYYTEIASDNYWDFRLLKRRTPIERKLLYSTDNLAEFAGSGEYFNAYEKLDTTFNSENPLLAEFNITVEEAPAPFNAWLVLQVDCAPEDGESQLVRIPLNLIKFYWTSTKNFTTCIVTGNVPIKIKRIVAYLWNIEKKEIKIKVNSFKLYQLNGDGVKEISKAKI
jgi:hypothetical protein